MMKMIDSKYIIEEVEAILNLEEFVLIYIQGIHVRKRLRYIEINRTLLKANIRDKFDDSLNRKRGKKKCFII